MYQNKIAYVALVISKDTIACGWLERSSAKGPIILRAYQKRAIEGCFGEQILFNPTRIGAIVSHFIRGYVRPLSRKKIYISTAFVSPIIAEQFIVDTHTSPELTELIVSQAYSRTNSHNHVHNHQMLWDYFYIYPTDTDEHVFYACAITQFFLLQYKLIALKHTFNLLTTTSKTSALLQLYRYMYGTVFRTAQLGVDMQRHNNKLENVFTDDILNRILFFSPAIDIIKAEERVNLLTMAGLFVAEKSI